MSLRPILAIFVMVATTLAGCSDGGSAPSDSDDFQFDDDLNASETTGIIRGVVVDASITPVAGATIKVTPGDHELTSTENGAFALDELDPGTYFISVSKPGYFDSQQSTEVVAGVAAPPVVKVLLEADASFNPFYTEVVYDGFIECTSSVLVICGAPDLAKCIVLGMCDPITNDRYTPTVPYEKDAMFIQTELVWSSTQPITENLYLEVETEADVAYITGVEGPSPLVVSLAEETIKANGIGGEGQGIYYSVFSGGDPATGLVGVTFQQPVTFYLHAFYGYTPPEGWRFTDDGTVPQPPR